MFCGNPMEDDDLFCTSCGKAIVDDADDSSAKKSADAEMMAEDATITSTRHMRNPNEAVGAGMAAGAAYGAGHAYGPDSPASMRPESNAYGHAPAGGAGGGEYGRAAAGGAGYGAGRPASNGGAAAATRLPIRGGILPAAAAKRNPQSLPCTAILMSIPPLRVPAGAGRLTPAA